MMRSLPNELGLLRTYHAKNVSNRRQEEGRKKSVLFNIFPHLFACPGERPHYVDNAGSLAYIYNRTAPSTGKNANSSRTNRRRENTRVAYLAPFVFNTHSNLYLHNVGPEEDQESLVVGC